MDQIEQTRRFALIAGTADELVNDQDTEVLKQWADTIEAKREHIWTMLVAEATSHLRIAADETLTLVGKAEELGKAEAMLDAARLVRHLL